jgi:hypothetical protein
VKPAEKAELILDVLDGHPFYGLGLMGMARLPLPSSSLRARSLRAARPTVRVPTTAEFRNTPLPTSTAGPARILLMLGAGGRLDILLLGGLLAR